MKIKDENFPKFEKLKPIKNDISEYIRRVNVVCEYKNYSFNGFCDKYGNDSNWLGVNTTFLKLKCNNCGNEWKCTNYKNFLVAQNGCPKCQKLSIKNANSLTEEIKMLKIQNACEKKNVTFNYFCDKYGNKINWNGVDKTYLNLTCNVCGYNWTTSSFSEFVNSTAACKKCNKTERLTQEEAESLIQQQCIKTNSSFLDFKEGWKGKEKTELTIKCNNCNSIWFPTFKNFINNHSHCRYCAPFQLEQTIKDFLIENQFDFVQNNRKILRGLELDFYLPKYNIAIECQGIQHFKPNVHFGGEIGFQKRIANDEKKKLLCEEKHIKLIYYSNLGIEYPYKVYENLDDILKIIKENEQ